MQIFIQNQKEYDEAVKNSRHAGNELVIQDCREFVLVHTDVTVAGNGRCKAKGDNPITITVTGHRTRLQGFTETAAADAGARKESCNIFQQKISGQGVFGVRGEI